MDYMETREVMCDICHKMWQLGWVAANDGNLSVKLPDGNFLATPTGISKSFITPEKLVIINPEGEVLQAIDGYRPSSEIKMHLRCYKERDDVGAVLHAHPPTATGYAVAHIPVDVQALDADFFAFSGHKVYGPMGIGVLYGREELLNAMPPFLTGGEMIESVTRDGAVFAELPHKFEAGTVNAADAVGLHAAIDYVKSIGFTAMHQQEVALTRRAMDAIGEMPHIHVLGSEKPEEHCGIITFTVDGVHPHDISEILASDGVAIRAGHHCAQPLLAYLKHPSTARASLAFYNTESEVDRLLDSISTLRERMGYGK